MTTTAQPFVIDANRVSGASEIYITSFTLYCKSRPSALNNSTGLPNPGVSAVIVEANLNDLPNFLPEIHLLNVARAEYISIIPSINATIETKFTFAVPVLIKTNKKYFFCIMPDRNAEFEFWKYTTNQINIDTNQVASSIISPSIGSIFELTSDNSSWQPLTGSIYKFHINAARFFNNGTPIGNNGSYVLHNDKFEFVKYTTTSQLLTAGERVYKKKISPDGNCSVVSNNVNITLGNSALFSTYFTNANEPKMIVIDGGTYRNVRRVVSSNGSTGVLDAPVSFTNTNAYYYAAVPTAYVYASNNISKDGVSKHCIFDKSTANSTIFFANGDSVVGEDTGIELSNCYFVDILVYDATPNFVVNIPPGTSYTATDLFNYTTDGSTTSIDPHVELLQPQIATYLLETPTVIMSRSNEVQLINVTSITDANSSVLTINVNSQNDFAIPTINIGPATVLFSRYLINNDYTNENTMYGNAISKEVSSKITLNLDQFAEDIIVNIQAYRPYGTDFKVFAKLYNSTDSDFFEDKDWTLLNIVNNKDKYSSSSNTSDMIEYSFELPTCPNTDFTYATTVTVTNNVSNVVASASVFGANIVAGDLVKIYSPLFPNTNFFVTSVVAVVNSTVITIDTPITNNSLIGSGLNIDHIAYKYQAFKNMPSSNVVRYYNSSNAFYDTYDTFAIKTVFLSESEMIIPFLSSCRAVAVSA
jgi:hypothetical protein